MVKVNIDGTEHDLDPSLTLLQACESVGAEIPRFCYHERLSIAGNCRMCLIEVEGTPKPQASCALTLRDVRPPRGGDMVMIHTNTAQVKKARNGVMEFLLINHPLDCPICDQGGECDLQDEALAYGRAGSRYPEMKRAVEEKYMGPLVKTQMTRCIHCTRCVRFMTEVAGVEMLGATGRGEDMEITTYLEQAIDSELSGNIIDLCPVGALTSKPYAFTARPWELTKTETIDVMDALGAAVRVDARGREVMRILPCTDDDINEEWISDKSRFIWDGLRRQRLDKPYVREAGRLKPASWDKAFAAIKAKLAGVDGKRIGAIAGDLQDVEGMYALKGLLQSLGSPNLDCRQDGAKLGFAAKGEKAPRASYLFNSGIAGIDEADAILLVGCDPRLEAPVLNARIRKRWLNSDVKIARLGPPSDLTYEVEELGPYAGNLSAVAGGRMFGEFKDAKNPMLIVGQGALSRPDGAHILNACGRIAAATNMIRAASGDEPGWNGFNVLHTAAGRVGGLDIGFVPGAGGLDVAAMAEAASAGKLDVLFLLGADEMDMSRFSGAFKIYIGSHGDAGAHAADVILPSAAYTEKDATWVNTEGRVQMSERAVFPPGEAKEDWAIFRALSAVLEKTLPYDSANELRARLYGEVPHMAAIYERPEFTALTPEDLGETGAIEAAPLTTAVADFYLTNPIARASEIMAECSSMFTRPRAMAAE